MAKTNKKRKNCRVRFFYFFAFSHGLKLLWRLTSFLTNHTHAEEREKIPQASFFSFSPLSTCASLSLSLSLSRPTNRLNFSNIHTDKQITRKHTHTYGHRHSNTHTHAQTKRNHSCLLTFSSYLINLISIVSFDSHPFLFPLFQPQSCF